ncbi:phosphatase PAP2 family protein [Metabacillus idriensis]|uniref:phosphatase PAP2 family protein n=1 Tax=Metabacillus idriensis TaxID=324768 RepID=UPI0028133D37|nr:phosphatase PAP2 family protein [Metabacillus idriensis]MDR0137779.1 phosphatase PAP2 family protein [Metabacillus idriensis]
MSKEALTKIRDLSGLLIFPVLGMIYELLNASKQGAENIGTVFDSFIPFVPVFILPYIFWYIFMFGFLLYFWWKNPGVYWKTIIAIVIGEIICFVTYFFFQTTVPRPQISGDGFLLQLVSMIYKADAPLNCFPSIHVLTTMIIMLSFNHLKDSRKLLNFFTQMTGILIILSTLFVKQHVIYDVIASIFLAAGLWVILFERKAVTEKLEMLKNTRKNSAKKSGLSKDVTF